MKKKYLSLLISLTIIFPILFSSCANKKVLKPDTPSNTALIMKNFIDAGNYEDFSKLFTEGRKDVVSQQQFNQLKKLTTPGTDLKHYEVLTFSNGKMLLVMLTQDKVDSEYKIQDVKEIPEEMKSLFK